MNYEIHKKIVIEKTSEKKYVSPLRYPGGKTHASLKIIPFIPNLNNFKEYRELFLGGGSMAMRITMKYPHLKIITNDLFTPLYNFWRNLQKNGKKMEEHIYKIKVDCGIKDKSEDQSTRDKRWEKTSELFYHCKDQIISDKGSSFEKAVAFFIVNRVSFSGLTISSSVSKSNTDTHFNLNSILKLSEYSKIIKNWEINNLSYEELLVNDKESFIYLDPPYEIEKEKYNSKSALKVYGKNGDIVSIFSHDDFAKNLINNKSFCLISYNDSKKIKDRFKNWTPYNFDHTYSMKSVGDYYEDQKKRRELILFNYENDQYKLF